MLTLDGTVYLNTAELARRLRMHPTSLSTQRCEGRSVIPYVKAGRAVLYRLADVEAYERLQRSTPR